MTSPGETFRRLVEGLILPRALEAPPVFVVLSEAVPLPKTLILLAKAPSADSVPKADAGDIPRIEYIELARALGATIFDFHDVERSTHPAVVLARKRNPNWGLATLGILHRKEYDHIYATGEDVGIPLGMLLHAAQWYGHTTVVIHHGGTPKRRLVLRALGGGIWRNVICLSERQWDVLVKEVGLPAHKVQQFHQWIDEVFYRPQPTGPDGGPGDYVFSCGRESRDYPLLQRAAEGLPSIKFRAVASGWAPHAGFDQAKNITNASNLVVEHGLSYRALRDAYAGARFVVVPLLSVDYAAGVTGLCEAMAMGKAVITTASPGVADYVKHGVSGLVVPVGDAEALRKAVQELWNDPARCARMGQHNRAWVEEQLSVTQYVSRVAGLFGVRTRAPAPRATNGAPRVSSSAE